MNGHTNGVSANGHDSNIASEAYARHMDEQDPLKHLRAEFNIPTVADLTRNTLVKPKDEASSEQSTYLCGNSLGVQPRCVPDYVSAQMATWASKGVFGHFKAIEDSPIPAWVKSDDALKGPMSRIVGAEPSEVAVMQTLTMNLHILMASFYSPTQQRHKIILEDKAFPSDHYMVESQIGHHGLSVDKSMILIKSPTPDKSPLLPTEHILSVINEHADSTAVLLLPGIQYYTGQFLDIPRITSFAQSKGILVGWDLAHAVGNVPLSLHAWNVDFAAWCNYKYMNCGPGAIGGLFVHERHFHRAQMSGSTVQGGATATSTHEERSGLLGWWGHDKATRFQMSNHFEPASGALAWQVSNPSALDHAAVLASLSVFDKTSPADLRQKSLKLTAYLERLLNAGEQREMYEIITPTDPEQRGAQLSLRLKEGLLSTVMEMLEEQGVVVDERKPDVVRVAPAPLYNNFSDAQRFNECFQKAIAKAAAAK